MGGGQERLCQISNLSNRSSLKSTKPLWNCKESVGEGGECVVK